MASYWNVLLQELLVRPETVIYSDLVAVSFKMYGKCGGANRTGRSSEYLTVVNQRCHRST